MKAWKHFCTITKHRRLVRKSCFKIGLIKQGLTHDLSKYSPVEFCAGVKYYTGDRSPNDGQRRAEGYSAAWLHHKGRNRHHFEYWIDYSLEKDALSGMAGLKMPRKYVAEMFCDRLAACKVYHKDNYTDAAALKYLERSVSRMLIHPETLKELAYLLKMNADCGEEETYRYIREEYLKGAPVGDVEIHPWSKERIEAFLKNGHKETDNGETNHDQR